jgi:hypothetical protein
MQFSKKYQSLCCFFVLPLFRVFVIDLFFLIFGDFVARICIFDCVRLPRKD